MASALADETGGTLVPTGTLAKKIRWINQRASRDDLVVELHLNSVQGWQADSPHGPRLPSQTLPRTHGCECWYYRYSTASELAAARIQNELSATWGRLLPGYLGRGIKRSAGLALLRNTRCRAVIVELEFIWNAAAVLAWQDDLIDGLVRGCT